jgi:ankyrin repeat protein
MSNKKSLTEALVDACKEGNADQVKVLLDLEGIDINAKEENDLTPLYYASYNGREEVVTLLLESGAYADVKEKGGWTPLHLASFNGKKEVVALLLAHGVNTDAKSD